MRSKSLRSTCKSINLEIADLACYFIKIYFFQKVFFNNNDRVFQNSEQIAVAGFFFSSGPITVQEALNSI